MNRRDFIQKASLAGPAIGMLPNLYSGDEKVADKVRLGFIGVGSRGRSHLQQALYRQDVEINAICDIDPAAVNIFWI